jgi:peptidoglycan/xylan/chitin deacetylase (PgdA/CDA1 family)
MRSYLSEQLLVILARYLPVEKYISEGNHRFIFPFWHVISDVPQPHWSQLYCALSADKFERDLDFLLKHYKPASFEDVSRYVSNGKADRKLFFPTFDDGMSECFSVIAPILKKKGIQAAFFINPEFVGNKMLFHRHKASILLNQARGKKVKKEAIGHAEQIVKTSIHQFLRQSAYTDHPILDQLADILGIDFQDYLNRQKPYLSLEQIRNLQTDGFLIGAHGMDHREFFLSSESEIINEISASMSFVIREVNPPAKLFAFPFTDFEVPDRVFEKAIELNLWDISFGTAGIKDEPLPRHIQRIPMESKNRNDAKIILRKEYLEYFIKKILGKNIVRRT